MAEYLTERGTAVERVMELRAAIGIDTPAEEALVSLLEDRQLLHDGVAGAQVVPGSCGRVPRCNCTSGTLWWPR